MNWLKKPWWRSNLFISSVFGGFISTLYVFTIYALLGKLEYSGFVDFMEQFLFSLMPMWSFMFVLTLLLYALTKGFIEKWKNYFGFSEKAVVGFSTFVYFFFAVVLLGIAYALGFDLFNSFAIFSTLFVAVVFATSMDFSLNKVKSLGKKV